MSEWYVRAGVHEHGPISAKKLAALAKDGRIKPTFLVRKGANGSWRQADRVHGLFGNARPEIVHSAELPAGAGDDAGQHNVAPEPVEPPPRPSVTTDGAIENEVIELMNAPPVADAAELMSGSATYVDERWSEPVAPPIQEFDESANLEMPSVADFVASQALSAPSRFREYKVELVTEGGCSTILFGHAKLPVAKISTVLNQHAANGWQVVFQIIESRRMLLFWRREAVLITFGR